MTCSAKHCDFMTRQKIRKPKLVKAGKTYFTISIGKKAGLYGLVIIACIETPVPIPNTNVKRADADGTMS